MLLCTCSPERALWATSLKYRQSPLIPFTSLSFPTASNTESSSSWSLLKKNSNNFVLHYLFRIFSFYLLSHIPFILVWQEIEFIIFNIGSFVSNLMAKISNKNLTERCIEIKIPNINHFQLHIYDILQ